jgi:hypothetical protein
VHSSISVSGDPRNRRTREHAVTRRECPSEARVRGREQHRQRTALGDRDQRWLLRRRRVEHRSNIVDLLL